MNATTFLKKISSAFLNGNQDFEDSNANDEFLQNSLWVRLDNNNFLVRKGKQIEGKQNMEIQNFIFRKNT